MVKTTPEFFNNQTQTLEQESMNINGHQTQRLLHIHPIETQTIPLNYTQQRSMEIILMLFLLNSKFNMHLIAHQMA